jgi:predicted thioesterase
MIRLMEIAALKALQPFCDPGEISVGTAINVEHRAPVGLNAVVKATAELVGSEGRFHHFKVAAVSGKIEIGRGTITRVIIKTNEFLDRWEIPRP